MIMRIKKRVCRNKTAVVALLLGCLSIAGILMGRVIEPLVAVLWVLLLLASCLVLIYPKYQRIAYLLVITLMAFTAECSMQLQIQHAFALSFSYQRIIDFCLYLMFFALFCALFKRKSTGLLFGNLFFYLVGTLNLAVTVFRGKPVYFPDIFSVRTAMEFADEYSFPVSKVHILCGLCVVACAFLCIALRSREIDDNGSVLIRLRKISVIVLLPTLIVVLRIPTLLNFRGYFFTTTEYWLYSFSMSAYQMHIEKPEDYDSDSIPIEDSDELPENFENQLPNVLFIMNESFADLRVIDSFENDDAIMPFFDRAQKEKTTGGGELHVSIYGGNTANTEFEVLTGSSMYYLPYDTTAYNLYVNTDTVSLASYFNDLGYRTIAFHPAAKINYNRLNVYPNLGFAECYFQEDYEDLETLRTFTSDLSNYEKVIDFFETKKMDERLFLFNLTVQNHGPFDFYDDNFEDKVKLTDPSFSSTQQYFSCLKYSDEALEMLLEYLEDYSEPVAVVFFGDHQAKIDNSFYEMLYGKALTELSEEESKKQYIVPYMIWTNYGVELKNNENISANYLGAYVIEQLGLPQTGYQKFLNSLRQVYPMITSQGICEGKKEKEGNEILQAYEECCYNLLFDKDNLWTQVFRLKQN